MTTLRIAVMHHDDSGAFFPFELRNEVRGLAELVWVIDSSVDAPETVRLIRRIGVTVDTAGRTSDETAATLRELGIDGVVSFVDDHIVAAAELAQRLGLAYHSPEVAQLVVNKRKQRVALAAAGLPGPRFWHIAADINDLELSALGAAIHYPAVLKTAVGSAGRHIHLVHDEDELRASLAESGAASPMGFLVEEYMPDEFDGDWFASFLSVESVVSAGVISHVALTGRFPLAEPLRESGGFTPAMAPEGRRGELFELAERAIRALGIADSITHTEIKLTPAGPRVIEVNGRSGGAGTPNLLKKVSSVNLFQLACLVAAGMPLEFEAPAATEGVAFVLLIHAPAAASKLVAVDGTNVAKSVDGVETVILNAPLGSDLDWREGAYASKVVTIEGVVPDHSALESAAEKVRAAITITTDAG